MPDAPNDPNRTPPPAGGVSTGPPDARPSEADTLTTPLSSDRPGTVTGGPPRTADWSRTHGGTGGTDPDSVPGPPGYEILGKLGEGGMGAVFKARQINLNRVVALKVVTGGGRVAVARFWAEAEVVAAVRHPNVVGVYEFGEHDGRPYLAMEFCPGGSLADGTQPLPPGDAATLVERIARGVAAAHDQGIVHRDLKPGNVLFDSAGEPKVADFGLAKRAAVDLTNTQAVMGTPAYMAPEQAEGRTKFAGPPADVWALGVILYELVAGRRPFEGESARVIMFRIMSAPPPALRAVARATPRDLDTIVGRCLAKEPELRYATAGELADDLARFVRGEPVAARRAGVAERAVRWARRKPTAAAAWVLGLLVLAVGTFAVTTASLWREAEAARGKAEEARGEAVAALKGESEAKGKVEAALKGESEAKGLAERALAGETIATAKAEEAFRAEGVARRKAQAAEEGERRAKQQVAYLNYVHSVDLAYREHRAVNVGRARELLDSCPPALCGWEWQYVHRLCHADLVTLARHTDEVVSASFSPDGGRVVTASHDKTARVWDSATGREVAALTGHAGRVVSASFSPDGGRVVTGSSDATARVWDPATGKLMLTLSLPVAVRHAQFSLNGIQLRVACYSVGDKTVQVQVFDAAPVNYAFRRITPLPRAKP